VTHLHFHHKGSEANDYGILAGINLFGALGELLVASPYLASSTSALADATHALSHSFTFALATGIIWATYRWKLEEKKAKSIRNMLGVFFLLLAFSTLIYIAYGAYQRLSGLDVTVSIWMFLAGCIGIATSLTSLLFLHGIQRIHNIRDKLHSVINADTLLDAGTSIAVVVGAILHYLGIKQIDPILTLFFVVPWIAWRLVHIFMDFIKVE